MLVEIYKEVEYTAEVGSSLVDNVRYKIHLQFYEHTHQVLIILVVDTRVLDCVTDSLQERRFASISPTDYENTETSIFCSKVIGFTVAHFRCGWVGFFSRVNLNLHESHVRGNAAVDFSQARPGPA